MSRTPDWLLSTPYAHRGLFDADIPENSLAAAQCALDAGLGIECDVRLSGDKTPVVFHDPTLDRMTAQSGKVRKIGTDRLTSITLATSSQTIPTLTDLLALVNGRVPLLIEVKARFSRPVPPVMRAVCASIQSYRGPLAIMSFDPRVPAWLKQHHPTICRGMVVGKDALTPHRMGLFMRQALKRSVPDFLAVDHAYLRHKIIRSYHKTGKPVLTWTIRSQKHAQQAAPYADMVIFEKPYDWTQWGHAKP